MNTDQIIPYRTKNVRFAFCGRTSQSHFVVKKDRGMIKLYKRVAEKFLNDFT